MFGGSWRIGSIGGVSVSVDASWAFGVLLGPLFVWNQVSVVFPRIANGAALGVSVLATVLFFGSILVHELAHAGVARARRIPVSGITLFLFGGATGARLEDRGPVNELLVTVAGPASSAALGALLLAAGQLDEVLGVPVAWALRYVGFLNVVLAIFNMLPGFPVDGGRVLRSVVWRLSGSLHRATRVAAGTGMVLWLAMVGYGLWVASQGGTFAGIWLAVLGWMLFGVARTASHDAGTRTVLSEGTVAEVMGPAPASIPAGISLAESLDGYLMGREQETFPVVEDGRVVGILTFPAARRIGRRDPTRPVRDAMLPVAGHAAVVRPDDPLDAAADRMGARRAALVLRDGELLGAISRRDIARWAAERKRGAPPGDGAPRTEDQAGA
ncbi:MAG: CBS domain-containing protein [Actinobacteria bacterium]|nr:CBS domain-containing protein [Actinomycetota bacterium]